MSDLPEKYLKRLGTIALMEGDIDRVRKIEAELERRDPWPPPKPEPEEKQ